MGSWDQVPDDYDGPMPQHKIVCNSGWDGKDRHSHRTIAEVRACFQAKTDGAWPCSWLMEGRYDDGSRFTYECGAPTRYTSDDGSYECDRGHDFVPAETRDAEGWDYAADEDEARGLAKAGVRPVQMDGKSFL